MIQSLILPFLDIGECRRSLDEVILVLLLPLLLLLKLLYQPCLLILLPVKVSGIDLLLIRAALVLLLLLLLFLQLILYASQVLNVLHVGFASAGLFEVQEVLGADVGHVHVDGQLWVLVECRHLPTAPLLHHEPAPKTAPGLTTREHHHVIKWLQLSIRKLHVPMPSRLVLQRVRRPAVESLPSIRATTFINRVIARQHAMLIILNLVLSCVVWIDKLLIILHLF